MKLNSVPQPTLARMMQLEDEANIFAAQADAAEKQLAEVRLRLNPQVTITPKELKQAQADVQRLVQTAPAARKLANVEQRLVSSVKVFASDLLRFNPAAFDAWLASLPESENIEDRRSNEHFLEHNRKRNEEEKKRKDK
jgi:hypothetical protein